MSGKNVRGRDFFPGGGGGGAPPAEEPDESGFVNVSIFDLMEALKGILARAPKGRTMELTVERFHVADKINHILDLLSGGVSAEFKSLFPEGAVKGEIIVTFLAVLELAKLLLIKIHQTEDGIIRVYPSSREENSANPVN